MRSKLCQLQHSVLPWNSSLKSVNNKSFHIPFVGEWWIKRSHFILRSSSSFSLSLSIALISSFSRFPSTHSLSTLACKRTFSCLSWVTRDFPRASELLPTLTADPMLINSAAESFPLLQAQWSGENKKKIACFDFFYSQLKWDVLLNSSWLVPGYFVF